MRTVKKADERRDEIVAAAARLFLERGYDVVTVNDILGGIGLSKGAFYHHFESKDDVLVAVTDQIAQETLRRKLPVLCDTRFTPMEKLRAFFGEESRFTEENALVLRELVSVLFREENLRLRLEVTRRGIDLATPHLAKILEEGMASGDFDVDDAVETARVVMQLGIAAHEAFADAMRSAQETDPRDAARALSKRVLAYQRSCERLIGIPKNSLDTVDPEFVERFFLLSSSSPIRPRVKALR